MCVFLSTIHICIHTKLSAPYISQLASLVTRLFTPSWLPRPQPHHYPTQPMQCQWTQTDCSGNWSSFIGGGLPGTGYGYRVTVLCMGTDFTVQFSPAVSVTTKLRGISARLAFSGAFVTAPNPFLAARVTVGRDWLLCWRVTVIRLFNKYSLSPPFNPTEQASDCRSNSTLRLVSSLVFVTALPPEMSDTWDTASMIREIHRQLDLSHVTLWEILGLEERRQECGTSTVQPVLYKTREATAVRRERRLRAANSAVNAVFQGGKYGLCTAGNDGLLWTKRTNVRNGRATDGTGYVLRLGMEKWRHFEFVIT